ncbi:putative 1-phosphatidylinositol-4,5-bisphosphate phosphodiesterase 1 [Naviculisporaceae sp. PSN 640]
MSSATDSPCPGPSPCSPPPEARPIPTGATGLERSDSVELQIQIPLRSHATSATPSLLSNPSVSPSSLHTSPTLSSEITGTLMTSNSSIQDSPEALEPCIYPETQGFEAPVPPLRLPDAITGPRPDPRLSHKSSATSLGPSNAKSNGPTAMGQVAKTSLIRRASNSMKKVTEFLPGRRASSTHPNSRDGSVGPGILRGRRGSTSNQEPASALIDSDDDFFGDKDESQLLLNGNGTPREPVLVAYTASSPSAPQDVLTTGPVVPLILRQGTSLTKVSKQKAAKQIVLRLDPDAAKISWDRRDRNRTSKTIYIDDIKEVRKAEDIRQYRLDSRLDESQEPRFFSILYSISEKPGTKVLHLVAHSDDIFRTWTETLDAITKHRQDFCQSLMAFNDKAIRVYWGNEMAKLPGSNYRNTEDGEIDLPGVERMCRSLHIHVPQGVLRDTFDMVKAKNISREDLSSSQSQSSTARLNYSEFIEFVRLMRTRNDIREVYRNNTKDTEVGMRKEEFMRFLCEVQFENIQEDMPYWESVFNRFARKVRTRYSGQDAESEELTIAESALARFLTSTSNPVVPKMTSSTDHLKRPVSEYYISSSHNTYLLGRQVAGESSVEGYISALLRGCRCVEIDCWDGDNDQPIVNHGHTFTSSISFLEVVKTINKYAFEAVQTPLWISLEVRCSWKSQANMARIMKEIFGEKLVDAPLPGVDSNTLPTPEQLMNRILIKVKQSAPQDEPPKGTERLGRRRGNSLPSPYQRAIPLESVPIPASPLLSPVRQMTPRFNTITEGEVHEAVSTSTSECESDSEKDHAAKKPASKINPILGCLGVYCMGVHFEGFDTPEAKLFNHIFSFRERTFTEKNASSKRALYIHNMKHLMRVYPNGNRISSSNFDPLLYWKRGVQMAALNWQTFDLGMQMNYAMFDGGPDTSGYVLKPIEGREIQLVEKERAEQFTGKRPRKVVNFTINVISAQQLMRPSRLGDKKSFDPYVEVEVFHADDKRNKVAMAPDGPAPDSQYKFSTKAIPGNGFNPEFNHSHRFTVITKYPDLVFVRWSVKLANNRSPPLATFMAKLSNLNQGYRTIPLLDHNGDRYLFSTLFCHIKKEPITEQFVDYQEEPPRSANKLRNIGRTVFNQSSNGSPKSSMESATF